MQKTLLKNKIPTLKPNWYKQKWSPRRAHAVEYHGQDEKMTQSATAHSKGLEVLDDPEITGGTTHSTRLKTDLLT